MAAQLPTLRWKKLRRVRVLTAGSNINSWLDTIWTPFQAVTYWDGSIRIPGYNAAWTFSRFQSAGLTEAVYGTPPEVDVADLRVILAGSTAAHAPTMAAPDTYATNTLLVAINAGSGAFTTWDAALPFGGTFFGYWRAFEAGFITSSKYIYVDAYECQEAICVAFSGIGGVTANKNNGPCILAGSLLDVDAIGGANSTANGRNYGLSVSIGSNEAGVAWNHNVTANGAQHAGRLNPLTGLVETVVQHQLSLFSPSTIDPNTLAVASIETSGSAVLASATAGVSHSHGIPYSRGAGGGSGPMINGTLAKDSMGVDRIYLAGAADRVLAMVPNDSSNVTDFAALGPWPSYSPADALLHFDGGAGSAVFTDSSKGNSTPGTKVVTASGGMLQSTTQVKFGASSAAFDGVNDFLSVTGVDTEFVEFTPLVAPFARRNKTVDCWVYPTVGRVHCICSGFVNATNMWRFQFSNTGVGDFIRLQRVLAGVATTIATAAVSIPIGAWTHVAFDNNLAAAGSTRLHVNGVIVGAIGISTNILLAAPTLRVGSDSVNFFQGFMDEFVIRTAPTWGALSFTPRTAAYTV